MANKKSKLLCCLALSGSLLFSSTIATSCSCSSSSPVTQNLKIKYSDANTTLYTLTNCDSSCSELNTYSVGTLSATFNGEDYSSRVKWKVQDQNHKDTSDISVVGQKIHWNTITNTSTTVFYVSASVNGVECKSNEIKFTLQAIPFTLTFNTHDAVNVKTLTYTKGTVLNPSGTAKKFFATPNVDLPWNIINYSFSDTNKIWAYSHENQTISWHEKTSNLSDSSYFYADAKSLGSVHGDSISLNMNIVEPCLNISWNGSTDQGTSKINGCVYATAGTDLTDTLTVTTVCTDESLHPEQTFNWTITDTSNEEITYIHLVNEAQNPNAFHIQWDQIYDGEPHKFTVTISDKYHNTQTMNFTIMPMHAPLPREVYDIDTYGVCKGFKTSFNPENYKDKGYDQMIFPSDINSFGTTCSFQSKIPQYIKKIDMSKCTNITSFPSGGYCFSENTNLQEFIFPPNITDIGGSTFSNDSSLNSVDLRNCHSITSLSASVFMNTGIEEVHIPSNITNWSAASSAFRFCRKLHLIEFVGFTTMITFPTALSDIFESCGDNVQEGTQCVVLCTGCDSSSFNTQILEKLKTYQLPEKWIQICC